MWQYSHLCYLLALYLVSDKINPLLCRLKVADTEKRPTLVSTLEYVLKCCYFLVVYSV